MANKNKSKKRKEYLKREKELNKLRKKVKNLAKKTDIEIQKFKEKDVKAYEQIVYKFGTQMTDRGNYTGRKFKDDIKTRNVETLKRELSALKDFNRTKPVKDGIGRVIEQPNKYRTFNDYQIWKDGKKKRKIATLARNINKNFDEVSELEEVYNYLKAKGKTFDIYYEGAGIIEIRDKLKEDYYMEELSLVQLIREYFECKEFENNEIYHLEVDLAMNSKKIQEILKKLGGDV